MEDKLKIQEMVSPMDNIKTIDESGNEWWNSRILAKALGYGKYWNFEQLIQKTESFLQKEKGLDTSKHFITIEEFAPIGSGNVRKVTSILLSRVAAMGVVANADKKKAMVPLAIDYFSGTLSADELSIGVQSNILLYKTSGGLTQVEVIWSGDTFWLSQKKMSSLFGVDVSTINYHLHNIDESGEVHLSEAIRKIQNPSDKWSADSCIMYNLDAVIAVGYRVNSYEATQFRIWATSVLKEYLRKGFVMNDERLKGVSPFGEDYFEELLERIREIRNDERRYYQKITDIYAESSIDYDPASEAAQAFFKKVQNVMHWAVAHQTAAEIIYNRADADKPNMGLMTWKRAPEGRIIKSDVTVAKNYLSESEIKSFNLLSTAFLDIAENRAERKILMTMNDWSDFLGRYIEMQDMSLLQNAGSVSHEQAVEKAHTEYDKYLKIQNEKWLNDFDRLLLEAKEIKHEDIK